MKIEKLTEDKLKITLSIDDLEERNINLHSFMYNLPESQDLFWDLIKTAEKECGFNIDDSMICVEASTSGSGNFTLLVTKTNDEPKINKISKPSKIEKGSFRLKRKSPSIKQEMAIYIFETFEDICAFCSSYDCRNIKNNELYVMENKYYLEVKSMPYNAILDYAMIAKNSELLEAKLKEYGKILIQEDALQTISTYFNKVKKKKSKKC